MFFCSFLFFLSVFLFFITHAYACVEFSAHECSCLGGQKRLLELPVLEFTVAVSCLSGCRRPNSGRLQEQCTLNCWAVSVAALFISCCWRFHVVCACWMTKLVLVELERAFTPPCPAWPWEQTDSQLETCCVCLVLWPPVVGFPGTCVGK